MKTFKPKQLLLDAIFKADREGKFGDSDLLGVLFAQRRSDSAQALVRDRESDAFELATVTVNADVYFPKKYSMPLVLESNANSDDWERRAWEAYDRLRWKI